MEKGARKDRQRAICRNVKEKVFLYEFGEQEKAGTAETRRGVGEGLGGRGGAATGKDAQM